MRCGVGNTSEGLVDFMGQGTWRVNKERTNWAVWANPVVGCRRLCVRARARCGGGQRDGTIF